MTSRYHNSIVFGLAGIGSWLFFGSIVDYFREPVAPDEKAIVAPAPLPRFDPNAAPAAMAEECRREGKQLYAYKTDGPDWVFDCIRADYRKGETK